MKAKINMKRARKALLGVIMVMCVSLSEPDAWAQQAPASAQEAGPPLQEVIVTGSRIPVPANISATSPTTVVSDEEVRLQGHTDITDVASINCRKNTIAQQLRTSATPRAL